MPQYTVVLARKVKRRSSAPVGSDAPPPTEETAEEEYTAPNPAE
jgi:hypothetical protein